MTPGGFCYHVINRGNGKAQVFHDPYDYQAFRKLLGVGRRKMKLVAYCLMPNHFHLVVWPEEDDQLSRWMQWLLTCHVRRHHLRYGTSGRVWQGRYKSFPIQHDQHLLRVLRYVERNPLRAGLVRRAEEWRWSSLHDRASSGALLLSEPPVGRLVDWIEFVNEPGTETDLQALRTSACRGRPYGDSPWTDLTVSRLGLESTLRSAGRPRGAPRQHG